MLEPKGSCHRQAFRDPIPCLAVDSSPKHKDNKNAFLSRLTAKCRESFLSKDERIWALGCTARKGGDVGSKVLRPRMDLIKAREGNIATASVT